MGEQPRQQEGDHDWSYVEGIMKEVDEQEQKKTGGHDWSYVEGVMKEQEKQAPVKEQKAEEHPSKADQEKASELVVAYESLKPRDALAHFPLRGLYAIKDKLIKDKTENQLKAIQERKKQEYLDEVAQAGNLRVAESSRKVEQAKDEYRKLQPEIDKSKKDLRKMGVDPKWFGL